MGNKTATIVVNSRGESVATILEDGHPLIEQTFSDRMDDHGRYVERSRAVDRALDFVHRHGAHATVQTDTNGARETAANVWEYRDGAHAGIVHGFRTLSDLYAARRLRS